MMLEEITLSFISLSLALAVTTLKWGFTCSTRRTALRPTTWARWRPCPLKPGTCRWTRWTCLGSLWWQWMRCLGDVWCFGGWWSSFSPAGSFKFFLRSFLLETRVLLKLLFFFNFFLDVSSSSRLVRALPGGTVSTALYFWIILLWNHCYYA